MDVQAWLERVSYKPGVSFEAYLADGWWLIRMCRPDAGPRESSIRAASLAGDDPSAVLEAVVRSLIVRAEMGDVWRWYRVDGVLPETVLRRPAGLVAPG